MVGYGLSMRSLYESNDKGDWVRLFDHDYYMEIALRQATEAMRCDEVPIGAVVVTSDGQVIGQGCNLREGFNDPTAHAEILALRDAARVLGDWRLYGCRLYVTLEPCMMCAGAIQLSRIAEVVYGAANPKGGLLGSLGDLYDIKGLNHYPKVTAGILGEKCAIMLKDFFHGKRQS